MGIKYGTHGPVLVTGTAGFVGCAVALCLLAEGKVVVGRDEFNGYNDSRLKRTRLDRLAHPRFTFYELEFADATGLGALFSLERFEMVIHLAA